MKIAASDKPISEKPRFWDSIVKTLKFGHKEKMKDEIKKQQRKM